MLSLVETRGIDLESFGILLPERVESVVARQRPGVVRYEFRDVFSNFSTHFQQVWISWIVWQQGLVVRKAMLDLLLEIRCPQECLNTFCRSLFDGRQC